MLIAIVGVIACTQAQYNELEIIDLLLSNTSSVIGEANRALAKHNETIDNRVGQIIGMYCVKLANCPLTWTVGIKNR